MNSIEVGDFVEFRDNDDRLKNGIVRSTGYGGMKIEEIGKFNLGTGKTYNRRTFEVIKKDPPRYNLAEYDAYLRNQSPERRRMDKMLAHVFGAETGERKPPSCDLVTSMSLDDFDWIIFRYGADVSGVMSYTTVENKVLNMESRYRAMDKNVRSGKFDPGAWDHHLASPYLWLPRDSRPHANLHFDTVAGTFDLDRILEDRIAELKQKESE